MFSAPWIATTPHDGGLPRVLCVEGQFACWSFGCVDSKRVCDGKLDCLDGSDEERCGECHQQALRRQTRPCFSIPDGLMSWRSQEPAGRRSLLRSRVPARPNSFPASAGSVSTWTAGVTSRGTAWTDRTRKTVVRFERSVEPAPRTRLTATAAASPLLLQWTASCPPGRRGAPAACPVAWALCSDRGTS